MENLKSNSIKNVFSMHNRVAIVTGGYGHLGSAMVYVLSSFGATVIVAGRYRDKFDQKFSNELKDNIIFEECDILDTASFRNLFKNVTKRFGQIDVVINNAHSSKGQDPEKMDDADWTYTLEGVLASAHKSIREVLPYMKEQRHGKIVNISSMYGVVSPDFNLYEGKGCEVYLNPPHYGAAKAALIQLTKYYASFLGKYNIQVNAITPGPFPKAQIQKDNPEFIEKLKNKNPLGKIGKPNDIAGTILLLSSNASDFITGQNIQIDGGWTIW